MVPSARLKGGLFNGQPVRLGEGHLGRGNRGLSRALSSRPSPPARPSRGKTKAKSWLLGTPALAGMVRRVGVAEDTGAAPFRWERLRTPPRLDLWLAVEDRPQRLP